jgi:hypothetical protein
LFDFLLLDGSLAPNAAKEHLLKNKTHQNDLINTSAALIPYENGTHVAIHGQFDGDEDQYVPPSMGNRPTLVGLDKVPPHHLQELLHHLSNIGQQIDRGQPSSQQGGGRPQDNQQSVTYLQVQTPEQVKELERETGAKFVEQAEDGSYILVVPNSVLQGIVPQNQNGGGGGQFHPDQSYLDNSGHHGPPYSHAPPQSFPGMETRHTKRRERFIFASRLADPSLLQLAFLCGVRYAFWGFCILVYKS